MRFAGLLCLFVALTCGCEKRNTPPAEPIRHDSKIDGSAFVTDRPLNDEIIQDQTKVSKNYQKLLAERIPAPATAPAVASAPAQTPGAASTKPGAVAANTPASSPAAKAPAVAGKTPAAAPAPAPAAPAVTAAPQTPAPPVSHTPLNVAKRAISRSAAREQDEGQ